MNICIVTCLNERPHVSRIVLECAERLGLDLIAGCHDLIDIDLVDIYDQHFVLCDRNEPAEKWSNTLYYAFKHIHHYTHFLLMGDDDSLSTEGLFLLMDEAEKGSDHVGFKRNGYVDIATNRAAIHEYKYACDKLIGAGRMLSRDCVETMCCYSRIEMKRDFREWKQGSMVELPTKIAKYIVGYHYGKMIEENIYVPLWDVLRGNGLDDYAEKKLVSRGYPPKAVDDDRVHVTDFKLANNIWQFDIIKGKVPCTMEECTWFLGVNEWKHLKSIIQ